MYINFQQNRVRKSVKTVHINVLAKNRKLHTFATTNGNFEKKTIFYSYIIIKHTCTSIFNKFGLVDQSKPYTQIYSRIVASCINLQLPIIILYKAIISNMHHRITYMYINF